MSGGSAGYAGRLREYPDKGVCGLPELSDGARSLRTKLRKLMKLWKASRHTVVLTGAGISTAAGIPDFRGPRGIWTLEEQEKKKANAKNKTGKTEEEERGSGKSGARKRKRGETQVNWESSQTLSSESTSKEMDFGAALPTRTHRALVALVEAGHLQFCVTQNVDGLHRRSGLSRRYHSVLHGCVFTEKCEACGTEYFRDTPTTTLSFQPTGGHCAQAECSGDQTANKKKGKKKAALLRDTLLDWEDPLPETDYERAQDECEKADLIVTLGTSLRIEPAASLVTLSREQKFVIVNLQVTPYDSSAALCIRTRVDEVMQYILDGFELTLPDDDEPNVERIYRNPDASDNATWWQPRSE